jgi:hypothetical protein
MSSAEPEIPSDPATEDAIDPDKGRVAAQKIEPMLAGVGEDLVSTRGVKLRLVGIKLFQNGVWLKTDEVRSRFAKLPADEFDLNKVLLVEDLARAVLHFLTKSLTASAHASSAKLPVDLVTESTEVRNRMLALVKYHFGNHPVLGVEIADIARGVGYPDIADDLPRLGNIYNMPELKTIIEADRTNYRPTDMAAAFRLSARIHEELGAQVNREVKDLQAKTNKAWTLLARTWDEVCAAGQFLYRKEPAVLERFASAHALGRTLASPSRAKTPKTETPVAATPGTIPVPAH